MWARVMALVNQQAKSQSLAPVGFANPAIATGIGKTPALCHGRLPRHCRAQQYEPLWASAAPRNRDMI